MNVTKTFLPPQHEYNKILKKAWDKGWITNRGDLVQELELKLKNYLGVNHIIAMTNGTLPIQIALNAYGDCGEIITTPFSYVATTASIVWEKCTPVFVDIHPEYLTIDENKIEAVITEKTTAILATHVFGNPCDVEVIEIIAKKHNLKVIYDAAHCFGVNYKKQSVFNYGDISTCSFHATKLFHTGEGGALFCQNQKVFEETSFRHNFGHDGLKKYHGLGINAKMSELQAAMGLSVYAYLDSIIAERKRVCDYYDQLLDFSKVSRLKLRINTDWNYSYYPIIFKTEEALLHAENKLNRNNIFPRRYFYPSLNTIPYSLGPVMPISESIASRVLCLPLYTELQNKDIARICNLILSN